MTIRMGYWDCRACGQRRIEGPVTLCTGCGKPRAADVQFYTDESAAIVEDPELVARARAGADWHCRYCNGDNRAGMIDCQHCGAGPDGTRRRVERFMPAAPPAPPRPSRAGLIVGIIAAVMAVLFGGCWFLFLRTTAHQVTIEKATWTKTAQVEELETQRKESWREDVPAGARELGRTTRSRAKQVQEGTTRVKVGKKDLGNGMFEDVYREEPAYVERKVDEPWVTYEIDVWNKRQLLEQKTTDGAEPRDPPFTAGPRQRIGARTHVLDLGLVDDRGKKYDHAVDLAKDPAPAERVKAYRVGQKVTAMVNAVGGVNALRP